jgi:hypothetical protein
MELTKEQQAAYERLKGNWFKVSEPTPEICGHGAAMVQVFYESGGSMWIGIEKDGHSHS